MKFGNITIGGMSLGSTRIGGEKLGNTLVYQAGSGPEPRPVEYIETDGTAYIDTGIVGQQPISSDLKFMLPTANSCCVIGRGRIDTSARVASSISNLTIYQNRTCFVHAYLYNNENHLDITTLIQNKTPFICKTQQQQGNQSIQAKADGAGQWTTRTATQNDAIGTVGNFFLFRTNYPLDPWPCPNGSRLYYIKIYNDYNFTNLIFDGDPCYYNGAYGLWDNVSNSFFGNSAGSGAFTGPVV